MCARRGRGLPDRRRDKQAAPARQQAAPGAGRLRRILRPRQLDRDAAALDLRLVQRLRRLCRCLLLTSDAGWKNQ